MRRLFPSSSSIARAVSMSSRSASSGTPSTSSFAMTGESTLLSPSSSLFSSRPMATTANTVEPLLHDKTKRFFEFDEVSKDVFRSSNLTTSGQQSTKAAFGGLIMAQAMAAAESTVEASFKPHSMHSYFILSVDTAVPVDYSVRRLREGRSFCTRSVEALQNGKVVFSLQVSFNIVEPDSCVHQSEYPAAVRPAAECPELNKAGEELLDQIYSVYRNNAGFQAKLERGEVAGSEHTRAAIAKYTQVDRTKWLFDMRCTDTQSLFGLGDPPKSFYFWIRPRVEIPADDERLHRWLLVFASDAAPAGVMFRPHSRNDFSPSMVFSLDHVMHFHHHDIRADEWLLYEVESTYAGAGRGFARGRIWRSDGKLLVSVTQEALIRTRGKVSRL